ncbi:putative fructose-1,6-bishosphatase [Fragilariopsis cylindrus CCMP1102]|uniref:fructose-bisphosphatase n=1 Tax=Fragilariopsis cylindrus CCMP1102 TaxID=635003 RepID=A0A1E7F7N5_9STRA|nr:putative fructose-1,6-bishosphatase [Fragilariopsis cylindrus CCMP1102]|eukprot:OEU14166.1 putative fructose-1,6-bishosphatase [Fragilariopsis cylindrus CCMP1102]
MKWIAVLYLQLTSVFLNVVFPFGVDAFVTRTLAGRSRSTTNIRETILDENDPFELPDPRWICPLQADVCVETGVTLSRYMKEMVRANPDLEEIESIFTSLQVACKTLSNLVRRSSLTGITGLEDGGGSINIQGEEQKKLDVISNDVLKNALRWSGQLTTLASEEEDRPVDIMGNSVSSSEILLEDTGRYVAVFDPLDGSSNVDAGIPVGTIFGIFDQAECSIEDIEDLSDSVKMEEKCLQDTLQPGNNLVAAGYCLYSSATSFVFTLGAGVYGFTLDENIGEFILTHADMKIPPRGKIYSFNEANRWDWDRPLQLYITDIQQGLGDTKSRYSSRYIGSMVGDVHRTLQYGGIFGYPADKRNPDGKLRLLYEAAPMAFILEQAGGLALTGKNRIMNIPPTSVHQRVPCILGSRDDVLEMRRYYVESNDPELIARCKARLKGAEVLDDDESSSPIDNLGSHNSDSSLNEDKEGDTAETIGEFGVAK